MRLGDISMRVKMFVTPIFLLAALLGLVLYTWILLSESRQRVTELSEGAFRFAESVATLDSEVTGTHAALYHLTSVAANDSNANKVKALVAPLQKRIALVSAMMNDVVKRGAGDPATKAMVTKLAKDYDAYKGVAGQVLNMLQFDTATATLFMVQAQDAFDHFSADEEALKGAVKKRETELVAAFDAATNRARMIFVIAAVIALIAAVGITLFFANLLSRPIIAMAGLMRRLATGELDIEIPHIGQRDEIGAMASSVQVFKDSAIERKRLAEEQGRQEEERAARAKRIENLCMAFDATSSESVKLVASAAAEMQSSSEAMAATAEEATRQASAVAAASEQASANVQTVASAAEELSSSIAEISRQVTHASEVARAAVEEAQETNVKVQGLAAAAQKIGEVVALITDIAEQTNLLALNATIEAARAGDAGKGFAVVASEVKNLANQTAKATDEIGTQITGIQAATQEAVAAIEGITKIISEINEVASGVASAVEEQGAATQEIARNVEQASAGTQEVSSNIAGVSQAANETGSAAGQIQTTAGELSQQSEKLRAEVDRFLADVRAA